MPTYDAERYSRQTRFPPLGGLGGSRYGCSHRRGCGRHSGFGGFSLVASAPERAILECLLLAPERMDLVETYGLLENLRTLRPQLMQSLLEACSSVKVKRLFMFMAERAGLPVPVVSHADLFGGKVSAALDRQHPRDLFDVRHLLDAEGFDGDVQGKNGQRCFRKHQTVDERPMSCSPVPFAALWAVPLS
jgi:hypothetical protein